MRIISTILGLLAQVVFWAAAAVGAGLVLRVVLSWAGVNPFSRIPYYLTKLTEPLVRPMRAQVYGNALRYDLLPLVTAVMILVTGFFISGTLSQFAEIFSVIDMAIRFGRLTLGFVTSTLVVVAGSLYVVAVFLRFFMPYFGAGYSSKFFRFVFTITEPLLKPLRRFFVFGMVDFSPLVAMFLVQLVTRFVADLLARSA